MGARPDVAGRLANEERCAGRLLAVWILEEDGYRFPPWQFCSRTDGIVTPIPEMAEILQLLREHRGVIDGGRRTSGWNEIEWFMTPHIDLDGATPIEMLSEHPSAVLEAAREEFLEDPDTIW